MATTQQKVRAAAGTNKKITTHIHKKHMKNWMKRMAKSTTGKRRWPVSCAYFVILRADGRNVVS